MRGGYFGTRPFGVPGCLLGRAARCARGRRPAREPSAPRASLGASSRSPARPRRRPPAPRQVPPAPSTPVAPAVLCVAARRLEARPGHAAAHGHRSQALPPPTGAAGDSRETVITFAGACSVSSETDGTIARQKHPFLMLCLRAKASRVSWWHPEAPALVPAVSHNGRASSFGAKKFAQHTKNGPKMVLYGVLGEYFRGNAANSLTLGEFFRGRELEGLVWVAGGQSPVFKPPRHPV